MVESREEALRLVREFREKLTGIYGERLKGVCLYGSYARDEANQDSDIDVAIVLEGPVNAYEESGRTSDVVGDLCLRENCLLVPFFLTAEEHRMAPYAVHQSIVREGVPV